MRKIIVCLLFSIGGIGLIAGCGGSNRGVAIKPAKYAPPPEKGPSEDTGDFTPGSKLQKN